MPASLLKTCAAVIRIKPMRLGTSVLLILCASCASLHRSEHAAGAVTHVVVVWLKTPGDESARQKLIDVSRTFRTIPGVIGIAAGRAVPSTRPVVDSSFDVAIVITFKDRESLRSYDSNPIHKQAVQSTLKPLVARQIVYDIAD